MTDRIQAVGDALIGSASRFRDPIAFVYTVLDYLVIAFYVDGGMCAEISPTSQFSEAAGLGWSVSTFPSEFSCDPEKKTTSIGGVSFAIYGHPEDTGRVVELFCKLNKWFRENDPKFPEQLTQRFCFAAQKWGNEKIPYSNVKFGDSISAAVVASERAPEIYLKNYIERSQIGEAGLRIAVTSISDDRTINVWPVVVDNVSIDTHEKPEAIIRACATGIAQWSRVVEGKSTLAVPCVVGGFPWAIFYMDCPTPDWLHGYRLYRDVLPRLFEGVRQQAKYCYLDELVGITDMVLSKGNGSISKLNDKWQMLSSVFPFSTPCLDDSNGKTGIDESSALLRKASESITPISNSFFPQVIGSGNTQSWGDILDMVPILKSAVTARLKESERTRENLGLSIAHDFKNLTANLAVVGRNLATKAINPDLMQEELRALTNVVAIESLQLSGISLAYYALAASGAERLFESSSDSVDLVRAAVRVMLELRSITNSEFDVIDEYSFREAVELLQNAYGSATRYRIRGRREPLATLSDLINVQPVAILLAVAGEPVRNIEADERIGDAEPTIKVRTEVNVEESQVLLFQEALEARYTNQEKIPSPGVARANILFPMNFCQVDPEVAPVESCPNFTPSGKGLIAKRVTKINVFGRPIKGIS